MRVRARVRVRVRVRDRVRVRLAQQLLHLAPRLLPPLRRRLPLELGALLVGSQ